ncbi:MAG: hypothetical protein AAGC54_19805, partial [Cyanobacteria bacterium P01_F01_bin.4]
VSHLNLEIFDRANVAVFSIFKQAGWFWNGKLAKEKGERGKGKGASVSHARRAIGRKGLYYLVLSAF